MIMMEVSLSFGLHKCGDSRHIFSRVNHLNNANSISKTCAKQAKGEIVATAHAEMLSAPEETPYMRIVFSLVFSSIKFRVLNISLKSKSSPLAFRS